MQARRKRQDDDDAKRIPVQYFEPLGGAAVVVQHFKQVGDLVDDGDALGHDAVQLAEGLHEGRSKHNHTGVVMHAENQWLFSWGCKRAKWLNQPPTLTHTDTDTDADTHTPAARRPDCRGAC